MTLQCILVIIGFVLYGVITRWIFKINKFEESLKDISENSAQTNRILEQLLYQKSSNAKRTSEKTRREKLWEV